MGQFDVDTLTDLTNRTILAAASISSTDHEAWRNDLEPRIANLNDAAQAIATNQSGSAAPGTNRQGEIFFDTDINTWLGDPDGSGHDDEFLTRLTAKDFGLATGGTATHKLMGAINVNTTAVLKDGATGVLMTYTVPASTLDVNGKLLRITCWGIKVQGNGAYTIQSRFGGNALASHISSAGAFDWFIQYHIVRTGATTQDWNSYMILSRDDTGSTTLVDSGTAAETLSNALAIDLNVSAINGADDVQQEGMIVELLQ